MSALLDIISLARNGHPVGGNLRQALHAHALIDYRYVVESLPGGFSGIDDLTAAVEQDNSRPLSAAGIAGLPALPGLPEGFFDAVEPSIARLAIHEAGHASVALSLGLPFTEVRLDNDAHVMVPECRITLRMLRAMAAAGYVSEVMAYGYHARWSCSLADFQLLCEHDPMFRVPRFPNLARLRRSVEVFAGGLLGTTSRTRHLPCEPPYIDALMRARDCLPDAAVLPAIRQWPTTLRIARLLADRHLGGMAITPHALVLAASGTPLPP